MRNVGRRFTAETAAGIVLLVCIFMMARYAGLAASGVNVRLGKKKPVVVLDAGHGGNDPGKVGVDGSLEKDINLELTLKLKDYLEKSDVEVILTREDDRGLYKEGDRSKKMSDMKKRCEKIEEADPDIVVSIHQNSYHEESVAGGQVFYYYGSEKGRRLAAILQESFDYVQGGEHKREAKANNNYYLLLHVKCPIVIAECGFLSNWEDAGRLATEEYRDRLAWALHMGIMEYLNSR